MTTKEKLIKVIDKLPEEKIEEAYKLLNPFKKTQPKIKNLKTFKLGERFDNIDLRKMAYEDEISKY